ncbi:MAG TPA: hypothetical protein VD793_07165 [Gemmatimonadales bacterium]|nr:hypothetical protein [Gemmatimonadales bacterium]
MDLRIVESVEYDPAEFESWHGPPSLTVSGEERAATVVGDFHLPCVNYWTRVHGNRDGPVLNLWLEFGREKNCVTEEVKFRYQATLDDLRPGVYQVRVFHELFHPSQGGLGFRNFGERYQDLPARHATPESPPPIPPPA